MRIISESVFSVVVGVAVAATIFLSVQPALAGVDQFAFTYKRSDLASDSRADNLYQTLLDDAGRYCSAGMHRAPGLRRAADQCSNVIVDLVVARISNPRLTAHHARSQSAQ